MGLPLDFQTAVLVKARVRVLLAVVTPLQAAADTDFEKVAKVAIGMPADQRYFDVG